MSDTGKDEHLIFPQKLFSSDFFYASDENNVVVFIHTTQESEDTLEDYILD